MSAKSISEYQSRIVRLEQILNEIAWLHGTGSLTRQLALSALAEEEE